MKAACIPGFGLEQLAVREIDVPAPAPHEVLVRVRAASLNYRDLLVVTGEYDPRFKLPLVVGSDAVGEIAELGSGVTPGALDVGDRVCPLFAQGWFSGPPTRETPRYSLGGPLPGVLAEYVAVRADSVVRVPDYLTDEEAACLPCAGLTAWSALKTLSSVSAGDRVLSIGAGGVSVFAIQIARLSGARVFVTTRDPSKHERLRAIGAETVIDGTQPRWGDQVRALAGGEGVDHVVELGGASTLAESLRAVRPGGTVSLIARFVRNEPVPSLLPVVMRNLKLQGVYVGHRESFEALVRAFAEHQTRPVVDSVYPLDRVRDAFEHLRSGRQLGKICLRIADQR